MFGALFIAGCSSSSNISNTVECPTFDGYKTNPARDFQRYARHAKSLRKSSRSPYRSVSARGKGRGRKIKMRNTIGINH